MVIPLDSLSMLRRPLLRQSTRQSRLRKSRPSQHPRLLVSCQLVEFILCRSLKSAVARVDWINPGASVYRYLFNVRRGRVRSDKVPEHSRRVLANPPSWIAQFSNWSMVMPICAAT